MSNWKSEQEKCKRMRGQEYLGYQRINSKNRKLIKPQQKRILGPPCSSPNCRRTQLRACTEFPEEVRKQIFSDFWNSMDWNAKKACVQSLVDQTDPKYPRKTAENGKKATTFHYNLKLGGLRRPVCKFMFMSTLGIRQKQLRLWVTNPSPKIRERTVVKSASGAERDIFAREFLASLPKLPSHYCRADSSKLYLEPIYACKMEVFKSYQTKCAENNKQALSRTTFLSVFREMNYGLYQPKKDQCDICTSHDIGNYDVELYSTHRLNVELARNEKTKDKAEALSGKFHVLAVDVQGVLLAPMLKASSLYYKTKLVVHNFTVYNLSTRQTTCYLWDETEGELVASVFATCLLDYLEAHFVDKLPIIIYSDGCTYQNRNAILSNALLNHSMKKKKIITQKYLEKGHTQMEVDSVHATIQRKLKGKVISHPYDYIQICNSARMHPEPYNVKYMKYSDFRDFSQSKIHRYPSIRPGSKAGDPQVTEIKQLQYLPDGSMRFKLDHSSFWTQLPREPRNHFPESFPVLYKARLPISKRKYQDLMDLLPVITTENHDFYKIIPHKN